MLAQNFKTAADLGITDVQKDALAKVLVLLETGKLKHVEVNEEEDLEERPTFCENFNMRFWAVPSNCGTAACIGGTAELIAGVQFNGWTANPGLAELFWPSSMKRAAIHRITTEQASTALRSYLTTGAARWDLAIHP